MLGIDTTVARGVGTEEEENRLVSVSFLWEVLVSLGREGGLLGQFQVTDGAGLWATARSGDRSGATRVTLAAVWG